MPETQQEKTIFEVYPRPPILTDPSKIVKHLDNYYSKEFVKKLFA